MKYCEQYAALLDLYLDGELPPEELERVQSHLETCPGCRAYVDDGLAIRAGFPEVEDTEVPEGFAGGVMERIRAASGKEEKIVELRRRSARRWMGSLAAVAACCGLALLTWGGPKGANMAAPAGEAGLSAYAAPGAGEASGGGGTGEAAEDTGGPEEERIMATAGAPVPKLRSQALDDEAPDQAPAAAPEAAMDGVQTYQTHDEAASKSAVLYLTAEEAGDLLDGFAAVWENAVEWHYELNGEEYRALLEALGRQEELPEAEEGPFLVVVSGPEE